MLVICKHSSLYIYIYEAERQQRTTGGLHLDTRFIRIFSMATNLTMTSLSWAMALLPIVSKAGGMMTYVSCQALPGCKDAFIAFFLHVS